MRLLSLFTALAACLLHGGVLAQGAVVTTPQVRAELVAHAPEGVVAGQTLQLGLRIDHQPHWHTYWKNPGDSGLPTLLEWQLPGGVTAGEIEWPTPKQLPLGPLVNFGFEDTLLLPVTVQVPAGFNAETLDVKLRAEWLVCKDVCIPESGEFALSVPTRAATAGHAALFAATRAATPVALAGVQGRAELKGNALVLTLSGLPAAWQGQPITFFPETAGVIQNAAKPVARWDGGTWTAEVPLDPQRSASPTSMPAVFTAAGQPAGAQLTLAVSGAWPALGTPAPAAAEAALPVAPDTPPLGLPMALLLALLGGALLNLMPCVFPVLSLKVLGFTRHADDRRALLAGGLAYTAGVVLSFVALAGLLLALRAGGEQLGWGFQLQSPAVVAALAALFTLIGLNLAGLFELGSVLPDRLATTQLRHPLADSALTGVLAVAIAAPCTAPFMGASLGFAVTLPPAQALSVFAALGLGMALPYLAASAFPALARALPRPGAWMATFKTLMAFPMFGTVVWLVWVLGQQIGIDGAAALLGSLVVLAFAAWALGSPGHSVATRRVMGTAAVLLLGLSLAWVGPSLRAEAVPVTGAAAPDSSDWQAWSPDRVAEAVAQGRPVFVDFTAAWCVTCQYNKRTTLADAAVKAEFSAKNVLLLRADWTRRDPAITAELQRLGRSGVPVYVVYTPGAAGPRLLSEILSVDEVRGSLSLPS
jgi:thiol:disulfide interchange protein DsbD